MSASTSKHVLKRRRIRFLTNAAPSARSSHAAHNRYCHSLSVATNSKGKGRGVRDKSAIPDEIYDALISIIEGERLPSVKERTRAQRSAAVRYWRANGDLTVKEERGRKFIYSKAKERRILRVSEVYKVVVMNTNG
ncbi:hypothetical protein ACROYT_G025214 [Oculina patagonica]